MSIKVCMYTMIHRYATLLWGSFKVECFSEAFNNPRIIASFCASGSWFQEANSS